MRGWIEEDRRAVLKGLKRYGYLTIAFTLCGVFVSGGMPGHSLWRWVGLPLPLVLAYVFALFMFFLGCHLFNLFVLKGPSQRLWK
jgi:hypothetical protein